MAGADLGFFVRYIVKNFATEHQWAGGGVTFDLCKQINLCPVLLKNVTWKIIVSPNVRARQRVWERHNTILCSQKIALTFRPFLATFFIFKKGAKNWKKLRLYIAIALSFSPFLATFSFLNRHKHLSWMFLPANIFNDRHKHLSWMLIQNIYSTT